MRACAWSYLYLVALSLVDVPERPALSCREAGVGMDLGEGVYRERGGKGSRGQMYSMKEEEMKILNYQDNVS